MVEGNASMYLGSPRMAEMVIGEKVSLEENKQICGMRPDSFT
jgi:acetyl-CoA carboxylase carboxyltransferase component